MFTRTLGKLPRSAQRRRVSASSTLVAASTLLTIALTACGEPAAAEAHPLPPCSETAAISFAIGNGDAQFVPVSGAEELTLHYGAQGGHHLLLGVDIANPSPVGHTLELVIEAETSDLRCADDENCDWTRVGRRWVTSAESRGERLSNGTLEIVNLLVVVDSWSTTQEKLVTVTATDSCERSGSRDLTSSLQD